jgi:ferredoxin
VVELDVIMAGYDPVALDTTVCRIIDLDPKKVVHLSKAQQKGLGTMDLSKLQFLGETIEEVKRPFKIPRTAWVPFRVPQALTDYIAKVIFRATVSFKKDNCVRCGTCWHNCPTKAITPPLELQEGKTPLWDKSKCITCYCCAETCPHEAVNFRINIPKNLFTSWIGPSLVLFLVSVLWLLAWLF